MAKKNSNKSNNSTDIKQVVDRSKVISVAQNIQTSLNKKAALQFYTRGMNYYGMPVLYNGEKNLGELGPITDLFMDYSAMSSRGHYAYITNEVVQIIINRMTDWVIGNGLHVESEPNDTVLKMYGINFDTQEFSDNLEARFSLIKESRESVYSRMKNLSELERTAFVNSCNGGGVLVVIRVRNGIINYDLIDGSHIRSQFGGTDISPVVLENGNHIMNGIEFNPAGEHVRFYVQQYDGSFLTIEAKNKTTGLTTAFIYGGEEGRIDDSRTRPVLSGLLETLSQMDGYKSATLGSAKEQNKVAYQTVYDVKAEGDSVFSPKALLSAMDVSGNDGTIPIDVQMQRVADVVTASTGNKAISVPPGGEIKAIGKNEAELYFESFWNVLFEVCCASAGIPGNVALMKYDASFSAARASIKDWAHSMLLKRYRHRNFLKPGYEMQLHLDILSGKIYAPGYMQAFKERNTFVLEAYRKARWVGDAIFEIDEMKEVEAVRAKLGPHGAHIPLMDVGQAIEQLGGGDSKKIIKNISQTLKEADTLGVGKITINEDTKAVKSQSNG